MRNVSSTLRVLGLVGLISAGCHAPSPAAAAPDEPAAVRATGVTDVSILSRGGGNGEADRSSAELGCWHLPGPDGYQSQPLLRFTGLTLPRGARVTSATLRLVFASWDSDFTVRGHYLTTAWDPGSARFGWLNRDADHAWAKPGAGGQGTDVVAGRSFAITAWQGRGVEVQTVALDVDVVQGWIDDPRTNHGVMLVNETRAKVAKLYASRHATHKPSLEVTYEIGPARPRAPVATTAGDAGPPPRAPAVPLPVASLAGLDARAANPTCTAPSRPGAPAAPAPPRGKRTRQGGDRGLALQPLFPRLSTGPGKPFGNNAPIVARRVRMPDQQWLWFIGLRSGRVFQVSDVNATQPPATNLIDPYVPAARDLSENEGGFLGLAFDPALATDPKRAHVYYVRGGWGSVALFRADVRKNRSGSYVASGEVKLLSAGGGSHHYGGDVVFGPDGHLYMSVGEDEIFARTRKPTNLRGKILRLDVHAAKPLPGKQYGIPADNPYRLDRAGKPNPPCFEEGNGGLPDAAHACPEVYARGFRNPFRISFDRKGGQLWVGDTGARSEEINLVARDGDHGWDTQEGTDASGAITAAVAALPAQTSRTCAGTAIIGGQVYRGTAMPALIGTYLVADNGDGTIYGLDDPYARTRKLRVALATPCARFAPASFIEDEHGELYVVSLNPAAGQGVFKLTSGRAAAVATTPAPAAVPTGPATMLSATGCVQPRAPSQPVAAAIPYEVNAELWADGLGKRRWMVLPDDSRITVAAGGDWELPVGSVLIKEFSFGGRRIETRLLVHHDDGDWAGYTYVWDRSQTDAVLATGAVKVELGDGGAPWTVPSREDCLGCHTPARGRVLGLETGQLNREVLYPTGRRANQLATLASLGVLDASFRDPARHPRLPEPADTTAAPAGRARAYLHANCAPCHPGPGSALDLRFETPLASMNICNVRPALRLPGGTRVVVPGDAAHSVLALRMKTLTSARMPRTGTSRVDRAGLALISTWINGLKHCR